MRWLAYIASLAWLLVSARASAHVSAIAHDEPGWSFAPSIVIPLAVSLVLFIAGAVHVRRRSVHGIDALRRRVLLFVSGWVTLVIAAVSPVHQAGELSFTVHMIEHELLMLVAAPLLVLSGPLEVMLWALPKSVRGGLGVLIRTSAVRGSWHVVRGPAFATACQATMLWVWHAPYFFEAALAHEGWHIAQHLSFLVSALVFWSAMLHRRNVPAAAGIAALCLFATSVIGGALGALMAFSVSPWYARYALMGMTPFGLTPVEDQQLAGLLMWIPGGLVHAGAALVLLRSLTAKHLGLERGVRTAAG